MTDRTPSEDIQHSRAVNIVWFRDDLRVADHPALLRAMADPAIPTVAIYVLDEESTGIRPLGSAARWWLHHGLVDLHTSLAELGVPLLLHRGPAARLVPRVSKKIAGALGIDPTGISVFWNRRYGGGERAVDTRVKEFLHDAGARAESFSGTLLHEPWVPQTQDGRAFKVFTPFYNALQRIPLRPALPAPAARQLPELPGLSGDRLADWRLLPTTPDWSAGLAASWTPGESPAWERLEEVVEDIAADYVQGRDRPDHDGTTRLSPALRWGHLSPVQVWEILGRLISRRPDAAEGARAVMRQLAWRDFCWNLLYQQPDLSTRNLRQEFDAFDWAWPSAHAGDTAGVTPGKSPASPRQADIDDNFAIWCRGDTGFALVDAGMKQLWDTGWMHNRVRMVTASLLVKNLGIHWRAGEEWFWDTLVDADAAANPANWQWVAGCGADASPYFRVFNPLLQAKKFDPQGSYVARFAPLSPGDPVVDLKESRVAALDAYARMKEIS